ncbi:MAG TPA: hypothetical protein VGH28_18970 [Polyangiaceae bacterium]|jgi:hypothetical protein
MLSRRVVSLLFSAALAIACSARTELDLHRCGEPEGVCVDVKPSTSSEVVFQCHIHVRFLVAEESHDGIIPVCLPPELNVWTGTPEQVAAINAMSQHDYDVAVARYGQDTLLGQLAALKAIDASGDNCEIWVAGHGDPLSYCNVLQATRDPFCENVSSCAPKPCVPNDCHDPALPDGTINPHACACNTTTPNHDDCFLPGATVCIPP